MNDNPTKTPRTQELERIARAEGVEDPGQGADPAERCYSAEAGEEVSQERAVREKLRLYPLAETNEIVASFAKDGVTIASSLVERVRQQMQKPR